MVPSARRAIRNRQISWARCRSALKVRSTNLMVRQPERASRTARSSVSPSGNCRSRSSRPDRQKAQWNGQPPAALEIGDPSLQCLKIGGGIGVIQLGYRWGRRILYQPVRCPADKPRHLFRPSRAGQCVEQPRKGDLALPGEQIVEFRVLRREVPTVKARLRPPGHQQNLRQPATQQRQQPAQIGGVPDIAAQADKIRPAGTEPVGHLFGGLIDVGVLHPQGMRQCATGACRRGERPGARAEWMYWLLT